MPRTVGDIFLSLRRITTSQKYIAEIDGLRFIAILSVILFHVSVQLPLQSAAPGGFWSGFLFLLSHGNRGVQLFFLISGFILGLPFASHLLSAARSVRLKDYYLRRVTRLEPPYVFSVLIRIPLLLLVMHKPLRDVLVHGIFSLLYLHSLAFGRMSMVNPPAWSLEVEIQFYCLAPLLAWSYFGLRKAWVRRSLGMAFILAAGLLQLAYIANGSENRLSLSIVNYVQYFFAGFILCDLYLSDWDRISIHWLWDLASMSAWCWIFIADGRQVDLFLPFVALIAYVSAFKGPISRMFFRASAVSLIGGMCYSIYLTHNLAITGVGFLLNHWLLSPQISYLAKVGIAYGVSVPVVLLVGAVLYLAIERPCMDKSWPSKLMQRFQRGVQTPSPLPNISR